MLHVLGLCGYARSGKDSAADALEKLGYFRTSFASELKDQVCRTFGITRETLEKDKAIWRPLLVEWGRSRRRLDPNYWIIRTSTNMPIGNVIVTDVRYLNEARWIWHTMRGYLIRIVRPGVEAANDEERESIAAVDKETEHRTFFIENTGSLDGLHEKMNSIHKTLLCYSTNTTRREP